MKKLLILLVVNIILICSTCFAKSESVEIPDMIRVGLYYSSSKNSVTLSSPGGIEIGTMNSNGTFTYEDEALPNESIVVSKGSKAGSVYIEGYGEIGSNSEHPYFKSIEKNRLSLIIVDGKKYRGNVEIRRFADSDLTVINHLSMQEYLYGVVPREIGAKSNLEAIKAQAIVARTYACKNYGKRSSLGFDLMPTVYDQAYGGYEWEAERSNQAVDETDGQVVVYDGEIIGAYYFSTSGGYTENSENVWSSEVDYLKAVPDTYEPNVEGNTTWEVTLSASEVKNKLKNNGVNVGEIIDLIPTKFSDVGRVTELKVVGTNGEQIITKQKASSYLGLKSQWYTINDSAPSIEDAMAPMPDVTSSSSDNDSESYDPEWYLKYDKEKIETETQIKSTDYSSNEKNFVKEFDDGFKEENKEENIVVEMKPLLTKIISRISNGLSSDNKNIEAKTEYKASSSANTFTFRGRGWGHSVGMSQNGAKGMADAGFSAEEIIKWYYSGVSVTK